MDTNNQFGARVSELMYGPNGPVAYQNDPTKVDAIIDTVKQQMIKPADPSISIDGKFLKEHIWPIMRNKGQQNVQAVQADNTPLKGTE
jgi:hypothetical protein